MTTHERIIEAIMVNGWTADEAKHIKNKYIALKAIKIDNVTGEWNYTHGDFAEKETQEIALDIVKNPHPNGQESDKAHDPYSEGWRAFEQGGREADNPYKQFPTGHAEHWKRNDWEYGYHTRASAPRPTKGE